MLVAVPVAALLKLQFERYIDKRKAALDQSAGQGGDTQ
jgi:hypothetical protein